MLLPIKPIISKESPFENRNRNCTRKTVFTGFDVFTALAMKCIILCDIKRSRPAKASTRLGRIPPP
jgi:hypothetical protein